MSKHTPGPWRVSGPTSEGYYGISRADSDTYADICSVKPNNTKETALLITAAPELLEALVSIVESLAEQDDEGLIEHAEPMRAARAAIAKAIGK